MSRLDEIKEYLQLIRLYIQISWIVFLTITSGCVALFTSGQNIELVLIGIVIDVILMFVIFYLTIIAIKLSNDLEDL